MIPAEWHVSRRFSGQFLLTVLFAFPAVMIALIALDPFAHTAAAALALR